MQRIREFRDNFNLFAQKCLKIKTKNDGIQPFRLNNIQMQAHQYIEDLKRREEKARIIFLKSRQVGLSTYTEARFFNHIYWTKALNAFVMSEKSKSTDNIFEMTNRFYEHLPEQLPKPAIVKSNSEMLKFETDSSFRVGTAGSKSVGRSMTINRLHGSEVAFWDNASDIVAGLFQTVPKNSDSEIILESTANGTAGQGAFFYQMCMDGLDKKSEWHTLFYPWFEHNEYVASLPAGFVLSEEEKELKGLYKLTDEQIMWRRLTINSPEFKGREHIFRQEYPSCIQEAFVRSGTALIGLEYIEKAKSNFITDGNAPIVIGVDPARTGDRTVIVVRQGRVILKMYCFDVMDEMKIAGIIARLMGYYKANRVFIDYGHGTGAFDRLVEQGYGDRVELVQFGCKPYDDLRYTNKRAEMYDGMRDWFMKQGGVFIKDKEHEEELIRDLMLIPDLTPSDSNGKMGLAKKSDIVKGTEINSTDFADALALTFASFVPAVFDDFNSNANYATINVVNKRGWE